MERLNPPLFFRRDHPDRVQHSLEMAHIRVQIFGLQRIETHAQCGLLVAFAIVPRSALQGHDKHIIADEMRALTANEQAAIGRVRPQRAQFFCRVDTRTGAIPLHRGAEIGNRRDRLTHDATLPARPVLVIRSQQSQMLAKSVKTAPLDVCCCATTGAGFGV